MVRTALLALLVLGTILLPVAAALGPVHAQGNGQCIVVAPGDFPPVHVEPEDCLPNFGARAPPLAPPAPGPAR